jgi:hypothetical protein
MKREKMAAVTTNTNEFDDAALAMQNDLNAGLKQRLILNFECSKLPNLDKSSKTDSFCVLWYMKGKAMIKVKLGQTETIEDCLDPVFVKTIEADFFFEENHKFLLEVYDLDDGNCPQNL